jgi:nucleotidyltransferase/DNA polymerase involved in DNA repair
MRLLHLAWPHLALRLARQRDPTIPGNGPLILGGRPWDDGVVLDASPAALALGVRRGIPLGRAHRLAPEAVFLLPDPLADAAAVEAALDALAAFSPGVAGPTDPADRAFGSLEVQVDGLEALWGPEPDLIGRIRAALAPLLPGMPRAGIAGTRFAAALAAAAGPGPATVPAVLVPRGKDAAFLAPFPASALTRDPEVRGRLARFGLATIGAVGGLPRSSLVARFGVDEGGRLHDRANGLETDPFRPRRAPERLALALALDEAVTGLDALRFVLRRLAGALVAQLDARGEAAGRARLTATLDPTFSPGRLPLPGAELPTAIVTQHLPEPTADPEALERLLLERLEREPPREPVVRLELELLDVVPAAGHQLTLFVPQANAAARLAWQLARLAVRFGEGRVGRVALADPEAPLPETRWTWHPVSADGAGARGAGALPGPVP